MSRESLQRISDKEILTIHCGKETEIEESCEGKMNE